MSNTSKNLVYLGVLGLSLLTPTLSHANDFKLSSEGGLTYGTAGVDPYYFSVGGQLKFDATFFEGSDYDKQTEFRSNANLRSADLYIGGGVGDDWSYTLSIESGSDRKFKIEDAWATYAGWGENFEISFGQILSAFTVESASSGKWIPFLERNMPTIALGPQVHGLGIMANKWDNCYSLNASVMAPQKATRTDTGRSDSLSTSGRITFTPVNNTDNILQVGVSGYYEMVDDLRLSTSPEASSRSGSNTLLDTGSSTATPYNLNDIKNTYAGAADLTYQRGSFYSQVEYQRQWVHRARTDSKNIYPQDDHKVRFHGYTVQAAWVVTGEQRKFKARNGTFGQVIPDSDCGAWEIAARYSFLNLRNKDIDGGLAHNYTFGVNYYLNRHVRVSANYIRSYIIQANHSIDTANHPVNIDSQEKRRKLNILATRLQIVF